MIDSNKYLMININWKAIISVALLIVSCSTLANPGILITIPFPLSPPTIDLNLPFPINDLVINNLELTEI